MFIADGAHNPQCAETLERTLSLYFPGQPVVFLIGVLADKDYEQMLFLLLPHAGAFICLTPDSPRALPAGTLAENLRKKGVRAEACGTAADCIRAALETAEGMPVIACGSLYMMGEIRSEFRRAMKNWQRRQGIRARKALLPVGPSAWRKGMYDIPEPVPERSVIMDPSEIDLVLCPCTAFDAACAVWEWMPDIMTAFCPNVFMQR